MSSMQTGILLKELRKEYGYTLDTIASMLGVTKAAVSKWENGDDIKTKNLYELAKIYSVSFTELYEGKRNNESNENFWGRTYSLDNLILEDNVETNNLENIKIYYDRYKNINTRFLKLLSRWSKDELNKYELAEFNFIKKYFVIDSRYYKEKYEIDLLNYDQSRERNEKFSVKSFIENIEKLDKKEYDWEIKKLYNFNIDIKHSFILKSNNLKALDYMCSSLHQVEKDKLLNEKLFNDKGKYKNSIDIENTPIIKALINSKANKLYQIESPSGLEEKLFNNVKGIIKEVTINWEELRKLLKRHFYAPSLVYDNWKDYSYKDYMLFIDNEGTDILRDIVNLRQANPKQYYENMLKRDFNNMNIVEK